MENFKVNIDTSLHGLNSGDHTGNGTDTISHAGACTSTTTHILLEIVQCNTIRYGTRQKNPFPLIILYSRTRGIYAHKAHAECLTPVFDGRAGPGDTGSRTPVFYGREYLTYKHV